VHNIENQLIALLPRKDRLQVLALCEPVDLVLSDILCEAGRPTNYIYLPTRGYVSLMTVVDGSPGVGVAMVGREGILGAHLALGMPAAPWRGLVQGVGTALRIEVDVFRDVLASSAPLHRGLDQYLGILVSQLARSASCPHFHQIGPRLARWLLMSQDRAHSDKFHVTHEFLAQVLGVRRVGITAAASALRLDGLIEYHRGDLVVRDRLGLKAAACSCYTADHRAFTSLSH